jgi:hypothetical protein
MGTYQLLDSDGNNSSAHDRRKDVMQLSSVFVPEAIVTAGGSVLV